MQGTRGCRTADRITTLAATNPEQLFPVVVLLALFQIAVWARPVGGGTLCFGVMDILSKVLCPSIKLSSKLKANDVAKNKVLKIG